MRQAPAQDTDVGFGKRHSPATIDYLGITTAPSFGKESSVALSIPRWASTSSGGVCVSHSDKDKSWIHAALEHFQKP